jgi:hydroxyethylthiazole kinase-like uncharacterized protein yjeF
MRRITPSYLRRHPLPVPSFGDKHARGKVLIIAGSVEIPGAALLAGLAALRAGAGVLQIATCETAVGAFRMSMPEARVVGCIETSAGGIDPASAERLIQLAGDADAVLLGPGMVDDQAVADLTRALLTNISGPSLVLDAEAFVQLRNQPGVLSPHRGRIIATPHCGEMTGYLGTSRDEIDRQPSAIAQQVSASIGATIVLKGAVTHVANPDGDIWICDRGCIGLGTSGSGDTLAGITAGLLARGASADRAACWAVYVHAEAGQRLAKRMGPVGFLAREIPGEIPNILGQISALPRRR